ncbi:hypothetical protein FFONT_0972 [Fervidicoccus fontis Kam940]|uniref:Uncharacterized protein n=2 Tax=Fervidicoccus fontis TaxID=683846 RepID=I0A1V3_FERFK|nr:hypothetical protein FFONT_0972 [Fervidicoccus fontis Kam940]
MASAIDRLVEDKIFQSRSEAIRYAIGSLISTHFNKKGKESWIEE